MQLSSKFEIIPFFKMQKIREKKYVLKPNNLKPHFQKAPNPRGWCAGPFQPQPLPHPHAPAPLPFSGVSPSGRECWARRAPTPTRIQMCLHSGASAWTSTAREAAPTARCSVR